MVIGLTSALRLPEEKHTAALLRIPLLREEQKTICLVRGEAELAAASLLSLAPSFWLSQRATI